MLVLLRVKGLGIEKLQETHGEPQLLGSKSCRPLNNKPAYLKVDHDRNPDTQGLGFRVRPFRKELIKPRGYRGSGAIGFRP